MAYYGMYLECHPVWAALALRRVSEGDDVESLLQPYPTRMQENFGPYSIYRFEKGGEGLAFTSLSVIAINGKLQRAEVGSCTWQFRFFGEDDPEFERQYAAYIKGILAARAQAPLTPPAAPSP
jgi:hypothetical protein